MQSTLLCLSAVVLGAAAQSGTPENAFPLIHFILYTNSQNLSYPIANASDLPADPSFDTNKPTALYVHGWRESNQSESAGVMSRAFLQRGSHNFILLDWGPYVAGPYFTSYQRLPAVGAAVGAAVMRMVDAGLSPETFWPIGHSLGGQLCGNLAGNINFTLNRMTGLDPAVSANPAIPQLSRDDAVLVDVIHTDAGFNGYDGNDGTIDFWPNGGRRPQPGCRFGETDFYNALTLCSHQRSWRFFAESVNSETAFPAVSCPSWLAFQSGSCPVDDNNIVYMGYAAADTNHTGTFYLRTAASQPYGLGMGGARPLV
ncbi:pancreatic triacylglycerol lipase-like [Thrips palmi]|uniref:Pancreatic triacylglycerol lipase-like n=1 Tax=Thrips palmi TaxID=161013 RepID=A0A6P9AEH5_THRPL|nr:pancreatic triacylglycerol lipase-like [Thrips palmi]